MKQFWTTAIIIVLIAAGYWYVSQGPVPPFLTPENVLRDTGWKITPGAPIEVARKDTVNIRDSIIFYRDLSKKCLRAYQNYTDSQITALVDDVMLSREIRRAPYYEHARAFIMMRVKKYDSIANLFEELTYKDTYK